MQRNLTARAMTAETRRSGKTRTFRLTTGSGTAAAVVEAGSTLLKSTPSSCKCQCTVTSGSNHTTPCRSFRAFSRCASPRVPPQRAKRKSKKSVVTANSGRQKSMSARRFAPRLALEGTNPRSGSCSADAAAFHRGHCWLTHCE